MELRLICVEDDECERCESLALGPLGFGFGGLTNGVERDRENRVLCILWS